MAERLTIIDFVEKYVAKYAKNPFLWEKNLDTNQWEATSYEDTLKKAKRIAAGLMALGVQKGEKVSYLSEGRDMWVIGELGVLYAGAVNVPLSILARQMTLCSELSTLIRSISSLPSSSLRRSELCFLSVRWLRR